MVLTNATQDNPNDVVLAAAQSYHGDAIAFRDYAPDTLTPTIYTAEQLGALAGTYAAEGFPLDIVVRAEGTTLYAQATGQGEFPLTSYEGQIFAFAPAGIRMLFDAPGRFVLEQGGQRIVFGRE